MKKTIILVLMSLSIIGCGGVEYKERIEPIKGEDGQNGIDGRDGKDGESSIINIVDPCGDGPGPDEVLLVMQDGSVLVWYQNIGFSILLEDAIYRTTDQQACEFKIVNSEVIEI